MNQALVNELLDNGFLVSPSFFKNLDEDFNKAKFIELVKKKLKVGPMVINDHINFILTNGNSSMSINWGEFDKSRAMMEKGKSDKIYQTFLDLLEYHISDTKKKEMDEVLESISVEDKKEIFLDETNHINGNDNNVIVLESFKEEETKKLDLDYFVSYFKTRYGLLKEILQGRPELQNVVSISRVKSKSRNELVGVIGMVFNKEVTKNGNIILSLEDPTGSTKVLIGKDKKEIYESVKEVVYDEVIGVVGVAGNDIIFCNHLYFPEVPIGKELKKTKDDVYVAFTSDLHVGSKKFLQKEFLNFVNWLNLKTGDDKQKEIARKVKYLIITGDLVDGVGIYPTQERDLQIKDIKLQYQKLAELISLIRKDIKIIICPGNHDALRISEPQPPLDKDLAGEMWKIPNVILVSNPSLVNIHSSENFVGFDVLLYHGGSYHYFIDMVESLRLNNAKDKPHHVSEFLLKKRHLAPTYNSSPHLPHKGDDFMVIKKIPDFFAHGEMHNADFGIYNNVFLISGGCWISVTDYQEKVGSNPDPAKVPIVNLKTRETKILNFNLD